MSSTQAPPAISHEAEVSQKRGQAVLIWGAAAFCIFVWEWMVCLPQEYRRIWRKNFTPLSVLYLVNRYFGLLQFSFVVSLQANAWSSAACKHMFYWEPVGALISTVLSQMILGARVYAIYAQSLAIISLLAIILVIEVIIGGIAISTTSPPIPIPGPPGSEPPCSAVMGPFGWLVAFWAIPLFYDTVTFLLTAWKAYNYWKKEVNMPLIDVIWRDGVLYFFVIFSMNFTNVVIFLTTSPSLRAVNLTPTLILTVILSCRIFLNLRDAHARASPGFTSQSNPSHDREILQDKNFPHMPYRGPIVFSSDTQTKLEPNRSWPDSSSNRVGEYPSRVV